MHPPCPVITSHHSTRSQPKSRPRVAFLVLTFPSRLRIKVIAIQDAAQCLTQRIKRPPLYKLQIGSEIAFAFHPRIRDVNVLSLSTVSRSNAKSRQPLPDGSLWLNKCAQGSPPTQSSDALADERTLSKRRAEGTS
jgi:hypothetical protein